MAHFSTWFLSFPMSLDLALLLRLSCGCNWPHLHTHPHHMSPVSYQSTKLSISGVQAGLQPTLFSLWVTFWPAVQVKTALMPTFCKPSLLISCLETYRVRTGAWLSTFWTAPHFSLLWSSDTSNFQAGPSVWTAVTVVDIGQCVCVTLDTQLIWVIHVHHIGQKAVQRLGLLSTVLW
jgi:hypothetical protein